jgi:hypothetical protein
MRPIRLLSSILSPALVAATLAGCSSRTERTVYVAPPEPAPVVTPAPTVVVPAPVYSRY